MGGWTEYSHGYSGGASGTWFDYVLMAVSLYIIVMAVYLHISENRESKRKAEEYWKQLEEKKRKAGN